LLDSYYPGWRGYVDGIESEVLQANYAFRSIAVGQGRHRVEFVYRPVWFFVGLSISGASLVIVTALILWKPATAKAGQHDPFLRNQETEENGKRS
jgi:uncharacterized membrane protein YfhO